MRRKAGIIAGACVAALTIALASQIGPYPRTEVPENSGAGESARTASLETATGVLEAAPTPDAEAEIARLKKLLTEREEAYAKALATIEIHDAENGRLTALLAEHETELTELRMELISLRAELEGLRTEAALVAKDTLFPDTDFVAASLTNPEATLPASVNRADRVTAVHFDPASASLSPGGQAHAAAAAVMLSDMKLSRIKVIGYTDSTGNAKRNRALAEARARAVADFLIRAGLPPDVIEVESMGEEGAPVLTGDGVTEPLNRCAEIVAVAL